MCEDKKYNGWTNYETWLVNLWTDGDESLSEMAQEAWNKAEKDQYFTREERATLDLADQIKDYVDEIQEESGYNGANMFIDMINASLREVDWHDIAENYISEVDKSDDEETEKEESED